MFIKVEEFAHCIVYKNGIDILKSVYEVYSDEGERRYIRYSELKEIATNEVTLNRRLDELKQLQLVERVTLDDKYRPTAYHLTEKGESVVEKLIELESLLNE